jgi:hypothetical protein
MLPVFPSFARIRTPLTDDPVFLEPIDQMLVPMPRRRVRPRAIIHSSNNCRLFLGSDRGVSTLAGVIDWGLNDLGRAGRNRSRISGRAGRLGGVPVIVALPGQVRAIIVTLLASLGGGFVAPGIRVGSVFIAGNHCALATPV